MVFTTSCPKCGKILWFASNLAGKLTICPACGTVIRYTPPADTEPAPAPDDGIPFAKEASEVQGAAAAPPPVGGAQREAGQSPGGGEIAASAAPAAVSPFDQIEADGPDVAPREVEQSYLTHQAAAAVGQVHVEPEESDTVQWTEEQTAALTNAPPPSTPPAWEPEPIAGYVTPAAPPVAGSPWAPAPNASRIDSLLKGVPVRTPEEERHIRRSVIWATGATLVVGMIIGVLWLLRGETPTATWEQQHRAEILSIKSQAETLALNGQNQEAYNKYLELERLVSGQTITDPFLQEELTLSFQRRDALYDQITHAHPASPTTTTSAPPPPIAPPAEVENKPSGQDSEYNLPPVTPLPTTQPLVIVQQPEEKKRVVTPHPPVKPDIPPVTGLTDAQTGRAISKAIDYLLPHFSGSTLSADYEHKDGLDTLVVYALMQAELATRDKRLDIHGPFMINAIDAMKKYPMVTDYVTYARSLRATALALYDRPQDHATIREDVQWLLESQEHGAFTYNNEFARQSNFSFWDNSNSQYGLLGVWSGAEVGIQVPADFWRDVRAHWSKYQLSDGQWPYRADQNDPSRSMTLAGIASLFVAQDYLDAQEYGEQVGRPPFSPALDKALKWLETGGNSVIALGDDADFYTYYALYGLERTGLASGFKYYGTQDWYRSRAADIIARQNANGSWGSGNEGFDTMVDTSFALLFLARGRHPILMNKLRYDGDWANRPRDAANLARFASAELERPLNWQVVPLNHDWVDWTDSPILYMAGDKPPALSEDDKQKIKSYIENGGMLLTQADGGETDFSQFVEDLGKQLFPQYHWIDLPADHVLFSVSYRVTDRPPMRAITNGSRILMLHWPSDLTRYWQLRQDRIHRPIFELGVNLALYAAGKSELKNRLESDTLEMPPGTPLATLNVARVTYDGNWNPEPQAWQRGRRWLRQQTSLDVDLQETPAEHLDASKTPLAHLVGTGKIKLSEAQVQSIKRYVESGGVLVIEPCGMPDDFLQSIHDELLLHLDPAAHLDAVADSSPMVTASGNGMVDISHPEVRQFVRSYTDVTDWRPMTMTLGSGRIIELPLDMSSGMLGVDAWGIAGYQPDYALQLMKNIVLWTWDGCPD
jgi:hypothetical protein